MLRDIAAESYHKYHNFDVAYMDCPFADGMKNVLLFYSFFIFDYLQDMFKYKMS